MLDKISVSPTSALVLSMSAFAVGGLYDRSRLEETLEVFDRVVVTGEVVADWIYLVGAVAKDVCDEEFGASTEVRYKEEETK